MAVNDVKMLSAEQQLFYGEFMSPAKMKRTASACKMTNIFVRFEPDLVFSTDFSHKSTVSNVTEIRPVGAALIRDKANRCLLLLCD